jgi:hypothetical protein
VITSRSAQGGESAQPYIEFSCHAGVPLPLPNYLPRARLPQSKSRHAPVATYIIVTLDSHPSAWLRGTSPVSRPSSSPATPVRPCPSHYSCPEHDSRNCNHGMCAIADLNYIHTFALVPRVRVPSAVHRVLLPRRCVPTVAMPALSGITAHARLQYTLCHVTMFIPFSHYIHTIALGLGGCVRSAVHRVLLPRRCSLALSSTALATITACGRLPIYTRLTPESHYIHSLALGSAGRVQSAVRRSSLQLLFLFHAPTPLPPRRIQAGLPPRFFHFLGLHSLRIPSPRISFLAYFFFLAWPP